MTTTKEKAIEDALRKIDGINKLLGRREIKELPAILWENELPEMITTGLYSGGNGLLVATNQRLIFINKGLMSFKMEDFDYDKITTIEVKTGMLLGGLTIYASGNKEEIKNVPKELTRPFADFLRAKLTAAKAEQADSVDSPNLIADELAKLADLRDKGILSEQEFASAKAKLLGV